jgi:hypothetical protein
MTKKLDVFTQASIYQNKQAQALIELSSVIFVLWIIFLIVYRIIMIYLKKEYKVPVKVKKVYVKEKVSMLPENISKIEAPSFAKAVPEKPLIEVKEVEEDTLTKKIEDNLTLEDYKVLLKMLKEQKRKERLARMKKQQEHDEQAKFRELQELYRSVK